MLSKWLYVSSLILLIQNTTADTNYLALPKPIGKLIDKSIDVLKFDNIFYDPITRLGLKGKLENIRDRSPAIGFQGLKCNREGGTFSCCAGINVTKFNFDRRACTNFTIDPKTLTVKFQFMVNEKVIFTNSVSGANPPPFCVPFYPPFMSFCVRFYNISLSGKNVHVCTDLETKVIAWPILRVHFDCLKFGTDGIFWMKPGDDSTVLDADKPEINEPEVYDEVDFENPTDLTSNNQPILTLAEEDNIGQLKL